MTAFSTPSQQVQVPELRDYIDGQFSTPAVPLGPWLENPNTGERAAPQMASDSAAVERALAAAWHEWQHGTWPRMPLDERAGALAALAGELDKRKDRIAMLDAFATGVTLRFTSMLNAIVTGAWYLTIQQMQGGWLHETMPGPNDNLVHLHRLPHGPALLLVAWNAPSTFVAHKGSNALAAGCPTILKPTEWAPYACDIFGEAAHAAGLPPGAFQIVHGGAAVGQKLVSDPRIKSVSFTGGIEGGRAVAAACAPSFKPAQLELGGNNPVIVYADADLDQAAEGIVNLMTSLNGQWCRALGRLVVEADAKDAVMERVLNRLAALTIGDSCDMATDMGPMIHSGHLARIRAQLDRLIALGGRATHVSRLPDLPGHFIAPTLVEGVDLADAQDEIFGPIGTVHTFESDAEMLALANGTPYGLEAYLFAGDEGKALDLGQRIHSGGVKINGSTILSLSIYAPRPAWGLSGLHEEGTIETFRFFTNTRVVGVEGPMQFAPR